MLQRRGRVNIFKKPFVFPGGVVEEDDFRWAKTLCNKTQDPDLDVTLKITAIRECAEETGLFLVKNKDASPLTLAQVSHMQDALTRAEPFGEVISRLGAEPDVQGLNLISWWVTPEGEERRYDTRFYIASAPEIISPKLSEREALGGRFYTPTELLTLRDQAAIELPPPTWITLLALQGQTSLKGILEQAPCPVRPICPRLEARADGGLVLHIPEDKLLFSRFGTLNVPHQIDFKSVTL